MPIHISSWVPFCIPVPINGRLRHNVVCNKKYKPSCYEDSELPNWFYMAIPRFTIKSVYVHSQRADSSFTLILMEYKGNVGWSYVFRKCRGNVWGKFRNKINTLLLWVLLKMYTIEAHCANGVFSISVYECDYRLTLSQQIDRLRMYFHFSLCCDGFTRYCRQVLHSPDGLITWNWNSKLSLFYSAFLKSWVTLSSQVQWW